MRIDPLGRPRPHLPSREGKSIWGWRSKNRGTEVILVIPPPWDAGCRAPRGNCRPVAGQLGLSPGSCMRLKQGLSN